MLRKFTLYFFIICLNLTGFSQSNYRLVVLGTAQDGGYPQAGCEKECCNQIYQTMTGPGYVSSLGIISPEKGKSWIFDCSPDFKEQLTLLQQKSGSSTQLSGIFLTHAHIGHYLGLAQLGREVMGAKNVPVYAMPRMKEFLENNGPWSQLIELENIKIHELQNQQLTQVDKQLNVVPALVPHRDEFSETVAFMIYGPHKKALYLPDIDKWDKWSLNLKEVLKDVDYAFIDATFYDENELPGRDMSEIPHPFVVESMELLKDISPKEKAKVHFIHMNHTNPLLWDESVRKKVEKKGFNVAIQGMEFDL